MKKKHLWICWLVDYDNKYVGDGGGIILKIHCEEIIAAIGVSCWY
jgi:hypothetical protein